MSKVLLLDVMSTLVYDPFYVEMPAFFDMTLEELIREKHPTAWLEFENGHWTEQQFLDSFFKDGRTYDQEKFRAMTFDTYRWLPGIEDLLSELKDADHTMHVVSNYPSWYQEIEDRLSLSRFLPWTFVSCDWGVRKPDPDVFHRLLAHLNVKPQDAIFVDDSGANCESAKSIGVDAILFQDAVHLRESLLQRGLVD